MMWVLDKLSDSVDVRLSKDEVGMLNNALNEVCNGVHIEDWEFQTRLGWDRSALQSLLNEIANYLRNSN